MRMALAGESFPREIVFFRARLDCVCSRSAFMSLQMQQDALKTYHQLLISVQFVHPLKNSARARGYNPDGNVSSISPAPHSAVRSSGSTARV